MLSKVLMMFSCLMVQRDVFVLPQGRASGAAVKGPGKIKAALMFCELLY